MQLEPPAAEEPPAGPRPGVWRCLIDKCPLRGRVQHPAPGQSAADAYRAHWIDYHYQPQASGGIA
ncbi:hypothetical protein ACIHFD_49255 [Nonomuraea sp. NPDC051941]|uniref:hypothetical protein n=1 Tax=Nonomuraea sp. NPDC051941 TaxID=3364373 RepID=UPI0037C9811A